MEKIYKIAISLNTFKVAQEFLKMFSEDRYSGRIKIFSSQKLQKRGDFRFEPRL